MKFYAITTVVVKGLGKSKSELTNNLANQSVSEPAKPIVLTLSLGVPQGIGEWVLVTKAEDFLSLKHFQPIR